MRRFSGAQPLARPAEAASDAGDPRAAEPALTPGDLDGELLQHLRRLSKRDPVTKLKALQARGAGATAPEPHCLGYRGIPYNPYPDDASMRLPL